MIKALINGTISDQLALTDRGLLYGDGVFETIAIQEGRAQYLQSHLNRLERGCRVLGIAVPSLELLLVEISEICRGISRAVLKIIITRGQGGRGYRPDAAIQPTRIVTLHPWPVYAPHYTQEGILATLCKTRLSRNPLLAGIKHLNRLEQVLARREWQDQFQEGLMLDTEDEVIEGTMSNLFLVSGGQLITPQLKCSGVAGIMREQLLQGASELGIPTSICKLRLQDVQTAESAFFCNSLMGIWPIKRLDHVEFRKSSVVCALMDKLKLS